MDISRILACGGVGNQCNSHTEQIINTYLSDTSRRGTPICFVLENNIAMFDLVILVGLVSNMKMCTHKLKLINTSTDIKIINKYSIYKFVRQ